MSSREARGKPCRDYPTRSDGKLHHGRGSNPPSRNLWVGNLSHNLTESDLAQYFLRFGELESIAFQPGRSYAFINYRNDEDAFDAIKELDGFLVEGNPLRIEFAKSDKSSVPPHNDFNRRDEPHSIARDSRSRQYTPDAPYINKSKTSAKDSEPSDILWIGFPAELKVDEFILRKAFSPFGEIEKITAFPGRTYAFVRYRNVRAACRAKETLQGKLFGNPRVHICFSKNESGGSNRERNSINASASPRGPYRSSISPEHIRPLRNRNRSPPFIPNLENDDRHVMGVTGLTNFRPSGNDYHERRRLPGNMYERSVSPLREPGARFRENSPREFPRHGQLYDDDTWDLPEDVSFLRENKKMKSEPFPLDNDLPEFPLSELGKVKQVPPREIPQNVALNRNFDSRGHGVIPDHLVNAKLPFGERSDNWNLKVDNFQVGSSPLPPPPPDWARESSSSKVVWKWEGMIAKVGTPVCRARCFPVGKPMDMVLPNYIDCTAKTSLDMLAKHYYQASSAWVVFFVPANDPDIAYYNEFMNYLVEKQRAAVSKLDERTTLFLVPPSEFSEKVLKVPGKLSISGVVLKLDNHGPSHVPLYKNNETAFTSFQSDAPFQKPILPPQPYLPAPIYPQYNRPGMSIAPNAGSHDYLQKPPSGAIWSNHEMQNSSSNRNFTSHVPGSSITSVNRTYSERMQETPRNNYTSETPRNNYTSEMPSNNYASETPHNNYASEAPGGALSGNVNHSVPLSTPIAGIQVDQLAQLASSLLGQKSHFSGMSSSSGEYVLSMNTSQSEHSSSVSSQNYGLTHNGQMSSDYAPSPFGSAHPVQQIAPQVAGPVNQQVQNVGQEEEEDPQKRLQATLELAAALLHQIQQGKGN